MYVEVAPLLYLAIAGSTAILRWKGKRPLDTLGQAGNRKRPGILYHVREEDLDLRRPVSASTFSGSSGERGTTVHH